ncbi:aspartic peptidase domain-containing protein [Triangularia verruculosa]|uniref:Aspartic peptidase domain-containing protein n=1 Tax=Triangularia verruculosa TaxID=2587418 RepID=A0AAN7ARI4_9PEZI|nr:aspartic peptidase domain-containing protein [Triangularia verruculosa]
MHYRHTPASFLSLLALTQVANCQDPTTPSIKKVVKVQWTTDSRFPGDPFRLGTFGPDGPWHALPLVMNKHESTDTVSSSTVSPVWPSPWTNISEVLWKSFDLTPEEQASVSLGFFSRSTSSSFTEWYQTGQRVPDWDMSIPTIGGNHTTFHHVKAPVSALLGSAIWYPSAHGGITNEVGGTLALAPTDKPGSKSILAQLKEAGVIDSNSFGLHMGSPKWNQSGDFTLGGYNAARVVGEVASFDLMEEPNAFDTSGESGLPRIYLKDAALGWEVGASPFGNWAASLGKNKSILAPMPPNMNSTARLQTENNDDLKEYALVVPDPTLPYLYLPSGICENAAEHLPVKWEDYYKLWFWDDEQIYEPRSWYTRIMNSTAYMSFTLQSNRARAPGQGDFPSSQTVTIKVPLYLLALQSEPPIGWAGHARRRIFPCRSVEPQVGYWKLGRAFLQAAFFGVNYDKNLVYLAQGIGPDAGISQDLVNIAPDDEFLTPNPHFQNVSDYYLTWRSHWIALEDQTPDGGSPSSPAPSRSSQTGENPTKAVAVSVAIAAFVLFALILGACYSRTRRKEAARAARAAALQRRDTLSLAALAASRSAADGPSQPSINLSTTLPTVDIPSRLARPPTYKPREPAGPNEPPPAYTP